MSSRYQYVRINGPYFCLQQNPVALAWLLFFRNKALGLGSLGLNREKALSSVKTLVRQQIRLRSNASVLELPIYGNLCLPVHRGYKAFDFGRKTVVRIFAPEVDVDTIRGEIQSVRNASLLDFAPSVRRWNIEERWYEEEFVIGYPGHSTSASQKSLLKFYYQHVEPCLEGMILLQAPLSVGSSKYVSTTLDRIEQNITSARQRLNEEQVNAIESFVRSTSERFDLGRDCPIDLVFSHGDFSLVNIMRTKDGIRVIDWESAGRRSALFDLYNYFFTEMYYERATTNLAPEIQAAVSSLQVRLASKAPGTARTLPSLAQMYRGLYYLERILVLLERKLSAKSLSVVLRSIEVFDRYEKGI